MKKILVISVSIFPFRMLFISQQPALLADFKTISDETKLTKSSSSGSGDRRREQKFLCIGRRPGGTGLPDLHGRLSGASGVPFVKGDHNGSHGVNWRILGKSVWGAGRGRHGGLPGERSGCKERTGS